MKRYLLQLVDHAGELLVVFLVGVLIGLLLAGAATPPCPTEDSCRPDYRNGRWVIERVNP